MVFVKRLLTRDCFDVELTLVKVVFGLEFVVFYTFFGKSEHIELSDVVKKSFIVINSKISAD